MGKAERLRERRKMTDIEIDAKIDRHVDRDIAS